MTDCLVSVVIIGRNEGERLARCLDSVFAMAFPVEALDVIYVDSGSTDGSPALAAARGARVVEVPEGPKTAARGRNTGLALVDASFALFLDGDTRVDPDFLGQALAFLEQHPQVAGVCGNRVERAPGDSVYNRVLDLEWNGPVGPVGYFGGDVLVRVAALRQVGGYRDSLVAGEEPELCHRLRRAGYEIYHLDLPMTDHDLAIKRFSAYWRRCYRTGYAYAQVARLTQGETFGRQSRRNLVQGCIYLGGPVILFIVLRLWALPLLLCGGLALWGRTFLRARMRQVATSTRLLYAFHSHLCQVPIFFGQVRFFLDHSRAVQGKLIEYK